MKKFMSEFRDFAMKGNVIDLAVGVIIGGAFGKIVSSLVSEILMPLLGLLTGRVNLKALNYVIVDEIPATETTAKIEALTLNYGSFLQAVLDFLIIAFCIFVVIKLLSRFTKKKEVVVVEAPKPTKQEMLLEEIRDLLKDKK